MHDDRTPTDEDRTLISSVLRQVEEAEARIAVTPERIGGYRILDVLGQGGMGVVYRAEQQQPLRTVALKVVRSSIVSKEMLRRFQKEVHALGRLHHVGIAQIYEGGMADGIHGLQPFFAMEFVDGLPLTDSCEARKLSVPERLELLAKVCDAVEHAHQKNVIHRDLKPSNILVDKSGQPKVLDFGVARVTDADVHAVTVKTEAQRLIGTLPYMSPEQIRGNPHEIDARSDVYALGVLGFRMLTGRYPFAVPRNSIPEAVRAIQEEEPARLGTVNRSLRGDVETIVLKTLEKDRERRYASAAELAADLRRYLNEEPIRARPPTRIYRLLKFARRNKALVIGVTFVILALSVGLVASTSAFRLAKQQVDDFRRLADVRDLEVYLAEADWLWPAEPANVPAMEAWLEKAELLRPRLLEYRMKLAKLREKSLRIEQILDADRTGLRRLGELKEVRDRLSEATAQLQGLNDAGSKGPQQDVAATRLRNEIRRLKAQEVELGLLFATKSIREFEDDADRLQHDVLEGLVAQLQAFFDPVSGTVASVRRRLEIAKTIEYETVGRYEDTWREAIASIANTEACPRYEGLRITAQIGLIPLGRDPNSGLLEFGHLQSGVLPERGSDGRLHLTEETGLVFVLLPGGVSRMGATASPGDGSADPAIHDPWAAEDESPISEVRLAPFFISKYEMTQAQWSRATGRNPSMGQFSGDRTDVRLTGLHPVENVTWDRAEEVLWQLGLALPTEARWEYAARAGTTTPWWTGPDRESLRGAANLADSTWRRGSGPPSFTYDDWLEDGYGGVHAPVGSFRPNAFGLHDVVGNVAEWCIDGYAGYESPTRAEDGRRKAGPGEAGFRVFRGGSFQDTAANARSATRRAEPPAYRRASLGVRPTRGLVLSQDTQSAS